MFGFPSLSARTGQVLLLVLALCTSLFGIFHGCQPTTSTTDETRLVAVLQDSLRVSRLENGQLRYEKTTLQGKNSLLSQHESEMNAQQKSLLATVKRYQAAEKKSGQQLISAGSIRYATGLNHPLPAVTADTIKAATDSTQSELQFSYQSDSVSYEAVVQGAHPDSARKPTMLLRKLSLPNEATVTFSWDEKRPGVPVSFSVANTNPLYRVQGLESYAIPDLRPTIVQPTGLRKLWQDVKRGAPYLVTGLLIGAAVR